MGVSIRQNKLKNNRSSLHLDIYVDGVSKYYGLDLIVYDKPKNLLEKEHNKRTLALAESVRAKRILEIQDNKYNFHTGFKSQASFLDYFKGLARERRKNEGNYGNWISTYKHLKEFAKGKDIRFSDCDEFFINRFKNYLVNGEITKSGTKLSNNSALSYFNKFKATLAQALNDRIISDNPAKRVKGIKMEDTSREYLSIEELKILYKTKCENPILRRAFLFSCLTGLRWSDINKLIWQEVVYSESEKRWRIHFKQKKTKGIQYHPISDEAFKLLGEVKSSEERVFKGLKYSAWNNHKLAEWIWKDGDIKKKITFHCARHTYATLLLSSGADIYTVSSLLGHKDLKTTQIYAKIIDIKKNETVDLLPNIGI